jgi:hypothetical protein
MNAAETSASSAMADCTPLAVVPKSCTTDEIETFMIDVSTTSTNIAIASRIASRRLAASVVARVSEDSDIQPRPMVHGRRVRRCGLSTSGTACA